MIYLKPVSTCPLLDSAGVSKDTSLELFIILFQELEQQTKKQNLINKKTDFSLQTRLQNKASKKVLIVS